MRKGDLGGDRSFRGGLSANTKSCSGVAAYLFCSYWSDIGFKNRAEGGMGTGGVRVGEDRPSGGYGAGSLCIVRIEARWRGRGEKGAGGGIVGV